MTDPRGTRAWRELRERVFVQQGKQCSRCGGTENIQVDHILPYDTYPELALDITNLQVLCRDCNIAKSNKTKAERINWYDPKWLTSIK